MCILLCSHEFICDEWGCFYCRHCGEIITGWVEWTIATGATDSEPTI